MKTIATIGMMVVLALLAHAGDQTDVATAYSKALAQSDFVFVCRVVDEGPLGHGSNTVQKSYKVSYPESLHFGLVGDDLPGEIWIHYDASKYPDVPESGFETTFHKGDSFVAFLDYVDKNEFAFQIVRLDKVEMKDAIKVAIKEHRTTPPTIPSPAPGAGKVR
jgi:hypothetical protein